jgi:hypothetical protein
MSPAAASGTLKTFGMRGVVRNLPAGSRTPNMLLSTNPTPRFSRVSGSNMTSPPSAVVVGTATRVFYRGANGHLWTAVLTRGSWAAPKDLGGVALQSGPAAMKATPTRVDVFFKGPKGRLWVTSRDFAGTGQWTAPTDLGGSALTSAPFALARGSNAEVFYRGTGNRLFMRTRVNGTWSGPAAVGSVTLQSGPGAVATTATHVDVYFKGSDGRLWVKSRDDGQPWQVASSLGGEILGSNPRPVKTASTNVEIQYRGPNAALWNSWRNSASPWYSVPNDLGGRITAAPSSVVTGTRMQTFLRGTDNHLWLAES